MAFAADAIGKLSAWMMPGHQRKKYIYNLSEGSAQDEAFLSRKAANLCELHRLGYSIPPAFILSSYVSQDYQRSEGRKLDDSILQDIKAAVESLGSSFGHVFGATSGSPPLLLSVRGGALVNPNTDVSFEESNIDSVNTDIVDILGAPDSWCIPGVKESCLGIGMNDKVVEHLAAISNSFIAYNTYAHFLVRFGTIVLGAPRRHYRRVLSEHVQSTGRAGTDLTKEDLMRIVEQFKQIADVPEDPFTQLHLTILEMYRCWYSPSAIAFRSEALNVPRSTGTAIIVQSIVFGGTGVCFSRSPVDGEQGQGVYGTFWAKSGEKIPLNADFRSRDEAAHQKLLETSRNLELHFKDMQQYEFVYNNEDNLLYILQVQAGRRTPKAAVKIAVDMVSQRLLTEREALLRLDANKISYFLQRHMTPDQLESVAPLGSGLAASRGVITAPVVFSSVECMERSMRGEVILCLHEAFPIDARALRAAAGVITMGGNIFSNAAVLCRGMGKPCVTSVRDMNLTLQGETTVLTSTTSGDWVNSGDVITLDGGSGRLLRGLQPTVSVFEDPDFQTVLQWADKFRKLRVDAELSTTADMLEQVKIARQMGADGIGCISTDGLFCNTEERINLTRGVLTHRLRLEKAAPLKALGELQREDLKNLFRSAAQRNIVVKLLDTALFKFLPSTETEMVAYASQVNMAVGEVRNAVLSTVDKNPDIGLRGCRITSYYPEITEMQVRAILCATFDLLLEGVEVVPKILVPMVCTAHELESILSLIDRIAYQVYNEYVQAYSKLQGLGQYYEVGAVFNSPRACMRAETIAQHVAFAAFSMNDLTALTFGCERSDAEKFFPQYIYDKIYLADPFKSLDDVAVGSLVRSGINKCREVKFNMDCSIVDGDHTSDPRSVDFFSDYGAQALSCPLARLPIARIAAAQSEIRATNRFLGGGSEASNPDMFWMF